uniref:F-box domain-containing protein n=1 Tax=Aegilops tauschii subsp. strangulata TaxID=200361 RepID=A0A453D9Q3_AEGTS
RDLPTDVLVDILLRLPPSTRRRVRLVCRLWRDVVDERTSEMQSRATALLWDSWDAVPAAPSPCSTRPRTRSCRSRRCLAHARISRLWRDTPAGRTGTRRTTSRTTLRPGSTRWCTSHAASTRYTSSTLCRCSRSGRRHGGRFPLVLQRVRAATLAPA